MQTVQQYSIWGTSEKCIFKQDTGGPRFDPKKPSLTSCTLRIERLAPLLWGVQQEDGLQQEAGVFIHRITPAMA